MKERLIEKMNNLLNSVSKSTSKDKKQTSPFKSSTQKISKNSSLDQQILPKSDTNISSQLTEHIDSSTYIKYLKEQQYPSLSELGLRRELIQKGQQPIFVDKTKVFCKMSCQIYQPVLLIITNYRMNIQPKQEDFTSFPLGKVERLHKYVDADKAFKILIQLKDGRKFKLKVISENLWKKIVQFLEIFSFVRNKKRFFAFKHFQSNKQLQQQYKGWQIYDPIKQFQRMKISLMPHSEELLDEFTSDFKILDNSNGKICATYPPILVVPSRLPYDALIRCAKFRSKQRMPALTYAHQYEKNKFACIYRSSQSKVGVQNSRSSDDQIMLQLVGNYKLNPRSPYYKTQSENINCKIYDARGYYAALGNKISGKGFESQQFYQNCKLQFLGIPNIHAVREAYNKAVDASMGQDSRFYLQLSESKWYEYIFTILCGALDMTKTLQKGINILVHCSDGWDRTAQLSSLCSIILDPYYRTIEGFIVSIQKDWVYFGHQFAKRLGQGINDPKNEDRSQVFLQFLDCVTQIMYQYPSQFEFNFKFIEDIAQQAYSNLYGNFLCNCHMQMVKHQVFTKTVSLWSKLISQKKMYTNPFYVPSEKYLQNFQANIKNMRFWKQHFLKHVDAFKDVYEIYSCEFTENNLQIMHDHIIQQKKLLSEKLEDNESLVSSFQSEINIYKYSDQLKVQAQEINIQYELEGLSQNTSS